MHAAELGSQKFTDKAIGWVAMLWGFCIVLPVGMQYLCLFLLLILMMLNGRSASWIRTFKEEKFWGYSAAFFIGITLFTLATQDRYYKETPANLWHGLRIVLTLMVGMSLFANEAKKAIFAAFVSVGLMSILVVMRHYGLLQNAPYFIQKAIPTGNEWIWMSILLAMLVIFCLRIPLQRTRITYALAAILISLALLVNLKFMNQRSSHIAMVVGMIALLFAYFRVSLPKLIGSCIALLVCVVLIYQNSSTVNAKFKRGFAEIEEAKQGIVKSSDSMNLRYFMFDKTTDMISERPMTGWGIGSWNDEWKKRAHPDIHRYNMPHNDLLWMGAQAGLPGTLAWLMLMLSLCWMAWKHDHKMGHLAFAWSSIAVISSLVNSGTRDAAIGLPLLFLTSASLAWRIKPERIPLSALSA